MEKVEIIERIKKIAQKTAEVMNKIMRIFVYICAYPALWFILLYFFDIYIFPSDVRIKQTLFYYILAVIWNTVVVMSIPTYLWFILTLFVKKIHPVITIIYFILFIIAGLVSLYISLMVIGWGLR
ncbi:MAG: hypothetical protein R3Y26_09980 [Rikenellaceae bacterium]